jgi:hypothetical protein
METMMSTMSTHVAGVKRREVEGSTHEWFRLVVVEVRLVVEGVVVIHLGVAHLRAVVSIDE